MRRVLSIIIITCVLFCASSFNPVRAATGNEIEPMAVVGVPYIGGVSVTSGELVARESETIKVSILFTPNDIRPQITCTVKVFCRFGSNVEQIGSKQIAVTKNTSVSVPVTISSVGEGKVYAKLYEGSTVIDTGVEETITVYGKWSISIKLYSDRTKEGVLKLYDGEGVLKLTAKCLGRSASGASMYTYEGNTPTGVYTGVLANHSGSETSYGPHKVIKMTGVSGAIVESGRSGIWIHGGRNSSSTATDYSLTPTNGCVRVTNGHQLQIQDIITSLVNNEFHYATGRITITE